MSDDGIWVIGEGGKLTAMRRSEPKAEDDLQTLIAEYCELIGRNPEELLLVRREQAISDSEDSPGRWSLDHLFVTRDAIPVLVEVKRASDTRIRREVVAQMLDYAANAATHWSAGAAAQSFAESCAKEGVDSEERLAEFLGPEDNPAGFWERVDQNFRDGRLRMLFVADEIPQELATIVEFLNEHTRDYLEVLAIELRHFEGEGGLRTLMRRVIGETAQLKQRKRQAESLPPISVEEWLDRMFGTEPSAEREGAEVWLRLMRDLGLETEVNGPQVSVRALITAVDGAKANPFTLERKRLNICFSSNKRRGVLANEKVRREIYDRLQKAVGTLSTANLGGWPYFPVKQLSDPETARRFGEVARQWVELCRNPFEQRGA